MEQPPVMTLAGLALAPVPSLPDPETLRPPTISRRTPLDVLMRLANAPACDLPAATLAQLNQLRRQHPGGAEWTLRQRLESLLPSPEALPRALQVRVDLTDELVSQVIRAPSLNARSRYWFRRLDSTLLLYLVMAPDCLTSPAHPLRETLDNLAWLGVGDRCEGAQWLPELEHRLDAICHGSGGYGELCETARFLKQCRNREQMLYERRVRCVRAAAEGQTKLDWARRCVEEQTLDLQQVPLCVEVLEQGWRDLMVLECLREEKGFRSHRHDLAALAKAAQGVPCPEDEANELLRRIRDGLRQVGVSRLPPNLEVRLWECLRQGSDPETTSRHLFDHEADGDIERSSDCCSQQAQGLWAHGVKVLQPGLWLLQRNDSGIRSVRLAWRNRAGTRFVFVSASGERIGEFDRQTVAQRLDDQQWCLDPEWRDGSLLSQSLMALVRDYFHRELTRHRRGIGALIQRLSHHGSTSITPSLHPELAHRPLRGLHQETRVPDRNEAVFVCPDKHQRPLACGEWLDDGAPLSVHECRNLVMTLLDRFDAEGGERNFPDGVGIPVPARLLDDDPFVFQMLERLRRSRLPARRVWLDVRKPTPENAVAVARFVARARKLGCRVCLSTIEPLLRLPDLLACIPADVIRADGRWLHHDEGAWFIEMLSGVCHLYGVEVMVDRITPDTDVNPLRKLGVDYVQYTDTCYPA